MKKYILSVAVLAILASCNNTTKESNSQTVDTEISESNGAPVMHFEKDVYEFGKIKAGEKVSYNFEFKNNGDAPLIIKDASATCGCTVPEWPKEPVAPGEKGQINVVFDSAGKEGLQDKVVTIVANTVPAQSQIHLVGEVTK